MRPQHLFRTQRIFSYILLDNGFLNASPSSSQPALRKRRPRTHEKKEVFSSSDDKSLSVLVLIFEIRRRHKAFIRK